MIAFKVMTLELERLIDKRDEEIFCESALLQPSDFNYETIA